MADRPVDEELLNDINLDEAGEPTDGDITSDIDDDTVIEPSDLDSISDDSVRVYLREIGRIPLLTPEEEAEIAYDIVKNAEPLAEAEQRLKEIEAERKSESDPVKRAGLQKEATGLRFKIKRLKRPKDKMAEANMRLVVSIAKRYSGRGLDFLDLIQEGNTGLLRAVEKFDPDRGFKFSTYATWSVEELAEALGETPEKIKYVFKIKQDIQSLDATIGGSDEDDASELGNFVEDDTAVSPEDATNDRLLKEQVMEVVGQLSDREQKIIKLRFGLDGGRQHTLEEVGVEFAVTRERIRQIEAKALMRLRKNKETEKLHDYLN